MPLVRAPSAAAGIEFEDRGISLGGTDGRMRHQLSEPQRKAFLLGVIEMTLIAEEDHLVFEQYLVDRADHLIGQVARKPDVPDFGADAGGTLDDVRPRDDIVDGSRVGHGRLSQVGFQKVRDPVARQGSAVRRSLEATAELSSGCCVISPLCGLLTAVLAEQARSRGTFPFSSCFGATSMRSHKMLSQPD